MTTGPCVIAPSLSFDSGWTNRGLGFDGQVLTIPPPMDIGALTGKGRMGKGKKGMKGMPGKNGKGKKGPPSGMGSGGGTFPQKGTSFGKGVAALFEWVHGVVCRVIRFRWVLVV